jgi:hypothetical protein
MQFKKFTCIRDAQIVQKSRSHLKIPSFRKVTWSKLHKEDPQIIWCHCQKLCHLGDPMPVTFRLESGVQQLCITKILLFQVTYSNSDTNTERIDMGKLNNNLLSSKEMKGNFEKETVNISSYELNLCCKAFLWNKTKWTAGEKQTPVFW